MSHKNEIAVIKKYANRRLYNTATSCYITLDDLYDMIKGGEDFIVVDAKTNEDLTKQVLTQIIFEQESKEGMNLLPLSFMKQLISLYGKNTDNLFPNYLESAMTSFIENQEKWHKFQTQGLEELSPMKFFENLTKQNIEIFEKTMDIFSSPTRPNNKNNSDK